MRITISELNNSASSFSLCWLPSEIKDSGGNIIFTTYKMLDRGDVVRPAGNETQKVSWSSMFPGESRKDMPILADEWTDPIEADNLFKRWKATKKILNLTIEDSGVSEFKCYIDTYESTYSGGYGDIYYEISFTAYKTISIQTLKKTTTSKEPVKNTTTRPAATTKTYKVKSGDTLWGIASKLLGSGSRWKEIYNLNKSAIEQTAKKRGYKSSDNGHWIFPGTSLKIPSK